MEGSVCQLKCSFQELEFVGFFAFSLRLETRGNNRSLFETGDDGGGGATSRK
jgi:hypothetical protein